MKDSLKIIRQLNALATVILIMANTASTQLKANEEGQERPPNVLFILTDDLGYGDLQCYGNPHVETPVLNRLADEGVQLTQHYSPSPLCTPARAGFLTGRYNHRTGAIDVSSNRGIDRLALNEKTFGDYFRSAGYATALIGKWHNGLYSREYLPHNRGFDLFYGFPNGEQDYWRWNLQRNDVVEKHDGRYLTDALNDETIQFIRSNKEQPFAIFLAHHAPHVPLQAPDDLVEKYATRLNGRYDHSVAIVYAMIEQMDTGLGYVFDELKTLGLWENTIIVFTSDNGAHVGSSPMGDSMERYTGGFSGTKGFTQEQGIRVPGIISWPGKIKAGQKLHTPVHGCDWLPTLYAQTAAKPPADALPMDGMNIMPFLRGETITGMETRILPFQKNRYTPVAHSGAAIRKGEWKLYWPATRKTSAKDLARDNYSFERGVEQPHWEMPVDPDLPSYEGIEGSQPELYNLVEDPAERHDLAAMHPDIVESLQSLYDSWFAEVFTEWKSANKRIVEHDHAYWENRDIPDPQELFSNYWRWDRTNADPATANPLEIFTGYWNYKSKR